MSYIIIKNIWLIHYSSTIKLKAYGEIIMNTVSKIINNGIHWLSQSLLFPTIELIASTEAINTGVIVGNNNTERIISCDFVLLDIIEKTFPIVIIPKVPSSIIGINFKLKSEKLNIIMNTIVIIIWIIDTNIKLLINLLKKIASLLIGDRSKPWRFPFWFSIFELLTSIKIDVNINTIHRIPAAKYLISILVVSIAKLKIINVRQEKANIGSIISLERNSTIKSFHIIARNVFNEFIIDSLIYLNKLIQLNFYWSFWSD